MSGTRFGSREIAALVAVIVVLGITQSGLATTTMRLNLYQLTAMADDVALGRVLYSIPRQDQETNRVITETHIAVDRYLKSSTTVGSGSPYVTVRQLGGYLPPYGFMVPGTATFRNNEWVVVFLKRHSEGTHRLVGWGQGKFSLTGGATGESTVQGSATALPSVIEGLQTEGAAPEDSQEMGGISLESFERRVRGLAAIHRALPKPDLDRGKAKGLK